MCFICNLFLFLGRKILIIARFIMSALIIQNIIAFTLCQSIIYYIYILPKLFSTTG